MKITEMKSGHLLQKIGALNFTLVPKVAGILSFIFLPLVSFADSYESNVHFDNPISATSLTEFINDILDIVLKIAVPVIVLFIIFAGFQFVTAQGNEEKLKRARGSFVAVIIGAAIILGAKVLMSALTGTLNQFSSGPTP